MQPLKQGSRGAEVTKLQQMLKDAGFFPKSQSTTEYFGPITEKALREYQASKGLTVDGIFGPQSNNVLKNNQQLVDVVQNLQKSGNATAAQKFQQLIDSGDQRAVVLAQGLQNNVAITPETLQVNREITDAEQAKYYQQLEQRSRGDLDSYLSSQLRDYGLSDEALQSGLVSDKNTLDDTEGIRGTWASSARKERANSLLNQYNQKFQANANTMADNFGAKQRDFEYNFGANVPKPVFNQTQAAFNGEKPTFSATQSQAYNPFGFVGRYNAERESNKRAGGTQNLTTQMYNPFNV